MVEANEKILIPALHKERWVSAFIDIEDNYEELLCNDVVPVANKILKEGHATKFIYRREAEDKLALYFRTTPANSETYIKPKLIKNLSDKKIEYNDYCILYLGSGNDTTIAEILLPFTSKIICDLIKDAGEEWSIETAVEKAIPLQIAMAHAFDMNAHDMYEFYSFIIKDTIQHFTLDVPDPEDWKVKFVEGLDMNFQTQKEALIGYSEYLINSFNEEEAFEEEWINSWKKTCDLASGLLNIQTQEKEITLPENFAINEKINVSKKIQSKWPRLMEYVRFINGQMGMDLMIELNLIYSLKESLKEISLEK
jgi:hypothetical protein